MAAVLVVVKVSQDPTVASHAGEAMAHVGSSNRGIRSTAGQWFRDRVWIWGLRDQGSGIRDQDLGHRYCLWFPLKASKVYTFSVETFEFWVEGLVQGLGVRI